MSRNQSPKHYIEILPAALLAQRSAWQEIAHSLPRGAYLLVANKAQSHLMQKLARLLRRRGRTVKVWFW
jgi:hypothetical protein